MNGRAGRVLRRLRTRLGLGPRVDWVFSEAYTARTPPSDHDSRRPSRILGFLESEGLLRTDRLHAPRPVSVRTLRRVHRDDYLESLQDIDTIVSVLGTGWPDPGRILDSHRAMTGGTVLATRIAVSGSRTVVNLGGGFHHALAGRGQGFCFFNDVAVAIAALRARGFRRRIAVIDLDLHDGDGTRELFADDADVFTLSIHNRDLGKTAALSSRSVALGTGVEDARYMEAVRGEVSAVLDAFRPSLVLYLAGADPARDDAIGDWRISAEGMLERDRAVATAVRGLAESPPLVVLLAGGYGRDAWRYGARFTGWLASGGRRIEPGDGEHATLARYRRIARRVRPTDLTFEPVHEWSLTEQDLVGDLDPSAASTRLLGYYTRHGVELALERLGFLDQLRALGYRHPEIRLDLASRQGQTLRIFSADLPAQPLVELRVRRDAVTVHGLELLRIEWLQLQHLHGSFSAQRPRLPGQRHPGLGLLRNVVAAMVLVCDRLELDGIVFTPAHYHVAVQSRRHVRFLDPVAEARFRALTRTLRGRPLTEATRAIEAGRVVDRATGRVVGWIPSPMVIPVTDRLARRVESEEYDRQVSAHAGDFDFVLRPGTETDAVERTNGLV